MMPSSIASPPVVRRTGEGTRRPAGAAQAVCLIVASTMPLLAIMSLVPVLPRMLLHFAAVPQHEWLVPMVLTMPSIMIVLFSGPMGLAADRWGRRPVLLASLVAFASLGLLPLWVDNLYAILATRLIVGLGEAGIVATVNALMGDYFEGDEREKWLGRQTMAGPLIASAYVLAGGALGATDWRMTFLMYLLGLPMIIAVLYKLREPRSDLRRDTTTKAPTGFPWPVTLRVGVVTLVVALFFFLQLVQNGRIFSALGVASPAMIGAFVTGVGVGAVAGGFAYSRLAHWSLGAKLALVFGLYAVGYVGLAYAPNLAVGTAFDMVTLFASGLAVPTLTSWALAQYGFEHRGRGMGLWNAFFSLGQFVSPAFVALLGFGTDRFLSAIGVVGGVAALLSITAWWARGWLKG